MKNALPLTTVVPGPRGIPWLGCLRGFLQDPMDFFTGVARRYGGIARIPLKGKRCLYLVSDPGFIRQLLVDNRRSYHKNIRYGAMQRLIGDGLLLSEGDQWRLERRLTQPGFKPSEIDRHMPWMIVAIENFLDQWRPLAASATAVDVEPLFSELTQYLAGRLLFGERFAARAREVFLLVEAIRNAWPKAPRNLLATYVPRSRRRAAELEAAIVALDVHLLAMIRLEREHPDAQASALGSLLQRSIDNQTPFTDRQLRDQLSTLFFAGFETTAAAMTWTHYLLSTHAEVRERVVAEVDAHCDNGLMTCAQIEALVYVDMVFKEALRVRLPIHAFARIALEENSVGGYPVPKGSTVTVSAHATHRLPEHWPDPEAFIPERFAADACAARHPFAYIPFGAGPRQCVGAQLAMLEGKLIVARVARRYLLDVQSKKPVAVYATTVSRPRGGMFMRIRERAARDFRQEPGGGPLEQPAKVHAAARCPMHA